MAKGYESLLDEVTKEFLKEIADEADRSLSSIRDELIERINKEFAIENLGRQGSHRIELLKTLPEICVVRVLLARFHLVVIDMTGGRGGADNGLLAVYEESGDDEGIYTDAPKRLKELVSEVAPAMSSKALDSVVARLRVHAPVVERTALPHLIAVANGVFDHSRQELREFRPEWVFLSKISAAYDPLAESPTIDNEDGSTWEVEEWMRSLSDDEGVPELLWEITSAVVRPHVRWNKSGMLAGPAGNGGKGTLLCLQRNLVGRDAYASIPLASFGERFMLGALLHANVNLVDENDVETFASNLKHWKSAVTGDTLTLESKYKQPVSVRWSGLDVQCFNTLAPKIKDKSPSISRRMLIVPMTKNFENGENQAIKEDYLGRPEVLRYVLKRALHMTHTRLSNPPACQKALEHWYGINNKIAGFFDEVEDAFRWPILPWTFLYDLYVAWLRKNNPSGIPESRPNFIEALKTHVAKSDRWDVLEKDTRPTALEKRGLLFPEPLIVEHDLRDWMNPHYTGTDPVRRSTFKLKQNYRGLRHRNSGMHVAAVEKRITEENEVLSELDDFAASMVSEAQAEVRANAVVVAV